MKINKINNQSSTNPDFKGILSCKIGEKRQGACIPDGVAYSFLLDSELLKFSGNPEETKIQKLINKISEWTGIDLSKFKNTTYCDSDYNRFKLTNEAGDTIEFTSTTSKDKLKSANLLVK